MERAAIVPLPETEACTCAYGINASGKPITADA
jgi:hypothetical protein